MANGKARDYTSAKYQEFNFGVGERGVTGGQGGPPGVSRIGKDQGGCVVLEHYSGGDGVSISRYERATKRWLQDYVDA